MARRRKSRRTLSRRKRAVLVGLTLIGTALAVWLDHGFVGPRCAHLLGPRGQAASGDTSRYHGETFSVVRVVDGDTLHLDAPDSTGQVTKVRLIGIDTPEMGWGNEERMYFAEEATAFARQSAFGRQVTVYLDEQVSSRDRYERLLAYIQLPDGRFLNEELLSEGFAYADLRFKHGYFRKYRQLEASARALKKGLWADIKPEQMPAWRQRREGNGDGNSE